MSYIVSSILGYHSETLSPKTVVIIIRKEEEEEEEMMI
jgi:hypothetical protein